MHKKIKNLSTILIIVRFVRGVKALWLDLIFRDTFWNIMDEIIWRLRFVSKNLERCGKWVRDVKVTRLDMC